MHVHIVENGAGNVVDVIPFCSDACHREFCANSMGDLAYEGWNGCHEGGDSVEYCAQCGVVAGGAYECDHQRDNVVVNRFRSENGERCEHGHWIQLPEHMLT